MQQLCRELTVSRSGYYDWRRRQGAPGARATEDVALRLKIRRVHAENEGVYGSPRVTRELKKAGMACGRHRVARLMRSERVVGRPVPRFRVQTTDSNHSHPIAPNRLAEMEPPSRPNEVWVTDITYVQVAAAPWV